MSKLIVVLFLTLYASPETLAYAGEGEGTRGGGELVDYRGSKELRDLVDRTNCRWKEGWQVLLEHPEIDRYLDRIAKMDWYFAAELRREIEFLDYCYTERLAPVSIHDRDQYTTTYFDGLEQAGIRLNRDVLVDRRLISPERSPETRAFFYIHEAMHSYIRMDIPDRKRKLQSAVETLYLVSSGAISSRADYRLQMSKNAVQFPCGSEALDEVRRFGSLAYAGTSKRREKLLQTSDLESLSQEGRRFSDYASELASWDRTPSGSVNLGSNPPGIL